jgi:hypothetical protein
MSTPDPTSAQPKISQKLIVRTASCLFLLAALFGGYRWFEARNGDFDFGSASSAGTITALQQKDDGQQLVVLHPDGSIAGTTGWKDNANDRDPVWSPDGKFVYFVSDRTGKAFHLYRWNPDKPDAAQMTSGTRGRSNPTFPAGTGPELNGDMLMICGGTVQGFDPAKKTTPQLLPPATANITQSTAEDVQGGAEAEFAAMYGGLGTAFRYARWCKSDRFIAAIMQREGGEVLIIQDTELKDGHLPAPSVIAAGNRIDFDVNPADGSVVYTVQEFRFPDPEHVPAQYRKNNKLTRPFAHMIGAVDPEGKKGTLIGISLDDKHSFGCPTVSPDGSTLLVTEGKYDASSENLLSEELLTLPIRQNGLSLHSTLANGDVKDPAWSPDGKTIAYVVLKNGHHDICTIGKDGSSETDITSGKGDFSSPKFSPQTKATG